MPTTYWDLQFANHNSQRSYPLTDWATGRDLTDTIELPDSFIVGLYFPIDAGTTAEPDKFFIKQVRIDPTGYNISMAYDDGATQPIVATVNVNRAAHVENRAYNFIGTGDFSASVGQITIGPVIDVDKLPPGVYQFDRTGGALEVDAIRPMILGISSLTIVNGPDRSAPLYGDIEVIAGTNMRITASQVETPNPEIIFNAISGEGLNDECACEEESDGPCIRFINGIPPLPDGNYRMVGDDCVEIVPITNGLQFLDDCSSPCCGCEELDALTRQIDRFADGVVTVQNYVSQLGAQVTQTSEIFLGSRLQDAGCLNC